MNPDPHAPSSRTPGTSHDPYMRPPSGAKAYEAQPDRENWRPESSQDSAAASDEAGTPASHFSQALGLVGELKEYASYLLATKVEGLKVTVRNLVIYAVLGVLGLLAGGTFLVTASVYVLSGIAGGLGALFHGRLWLGELIVGILVLGGTAAGVILGMKFLTRTFRKQVVDTYEQRKRQQRENFGHDVQHRATEAKAGR